MIHREELMLVKRLASRANPRVKDWAGLGERSCRARLGLTLAEGARLAGEGLETAAGGGSFRPVALLVSDSGAARSDAGALFARAGEKGVERFSLSDDCYAKISDLKNADGLALVLSFSEARPGTAGDWTADGARWLIAAGVRDPGNAGALARTALAAGATGCLFLDGADPHSPKFLRGSMGAAFRMPCLAMTAGEFIREWGRGGASLIVASPDSAADDFREIDYRPPMALLVGGERGVPGELAALGGRAAHIPLHNGAESLNLAVAAGIILFEAERQWRGGR